MLVKLGEVWVDPTKVEGLSFDDGLMRISTAHHIYHTNITTESINDSAAIINNAVGQSYGGEDEEAGPPVA